MQKSTLLPQTFLIGQLASHVTIKQCTATDQWVKQGTARGLAQVVLSVCKKEDDSGGQIQQPLRLACSNSSGTLCLPHDSCQNEVLL